MSAPLQIGLLTATKFDQCANALRAIWIDCDGVMSRRVFEDTCRDRNVDPVYMQVVFEGMAPFKVVKGPTHYTREADHFVFPIYAKRFIG